SGAVILTGEALKRRNARAIADLFSEEAGKFVCASAGHHMECQMAAHGSGAVALSRGHNATLLNVDIGGGTTKFALIENGRILATCPIAVGGRLIVEADGGGLTRMEEPAEKIAKALGIELALGAPLAPENRRGIAARMARMVMGLIDLRQGGELARALLVTEGWPAELANRSIDAITFSGGVAEYLYKRALRRSRLGPGRGAAPCAGAPARPCSGLGPRPRHSRDRHRRCAILGPDQRQHHPDRRPRQAAATKPAGAVVRLRCGRRSHSRCRRCWRARRAHARRLRGRGKPDRARVPVARRSLAWALACGRDRHLRRAAADVA